MDDSNRFHLGFCVCESLNERNVLSSSKEQKTWKKTKKKKKKKKKKDLDQGAGAGGS